MSRADEADVIGAREASRITRIPSEGAILLDLWAEKGMWVYLYMDEKLYDPSNESDYDALWDAFNSARKESRTLRKRVTGGMDRARKKGRVGGRTPYGLVVHYDAKKKPVRTVALSCTRQGCKWWYGAIPRDGAGQAVKECPACGGKVAELQAEIVREIIGWAADGKKPSGIALRLNKRSVPPPTRTGRYGTDEQGRPLKAVKDADGNPTGELVPVSKYGIWTHETVLGHATNPVYAGRICKEPAVTPGHHKRPHGGPRDRDLGNTIPAPDYPAIVDEETFWRAVNCLDTARSDRDREGKPNSYNIRDGAAAHDLTHIALCAVHRAPDHAWQQAGGGTEGHPAQRHARSVGRVR